MRAAANASIAVSADRPATSAGARARVRALRGSAGARNVGWLSLERAVGLVNGAAVTVFVARELGAAGWAQVSFFTALLYLATPFVVAVQPLVLVAITQRPAALSSALRSGQRLARIAAWVSLTVTLLLTLTARHGLLGSESRLTGLLLLVTVLARPGTVVEALFQRDLQQKGLAQRRIAVALAAALARLSIAALTASPALVLLAYAGEQLLLCMAVSRHPRSRRVLDRAVPVDAELVRTWWRAMLPTCVAVTGVVIYMRTDQVLLTHFATPAVVGSYAVAATLAEAPYFLGTAIATSVAPGLSRDFLAAGPAYARRLVSLERGVAAAGLVIAALTSLLAGPVVALLFGPAFSASVVPLQILAWATPFVFLGVIQSTDTILRGLQRQAMERTTVAAVVNISFNLVFMSRWGAEAAAISTVLCQALSAVLLNATSARTRGVCASQLRALSLTWLIRTRG